MKPRKNILTLLLSGLYILSATARIPFLRDYDPGKTAPKVRKYLYVVTPGVRNYLGYGGHGIQVFDIDNNHRFVKFIKTPAGLNKEGKPSNVKGVDVSLATNCIYISTLEAIQCIDLITEKLLWEKQYEGGVDRISISPTEASSMRPHLKKNSGMYWMQKTERSSKK